MTGEEQVLCVSGWAHTPEVFDLIRRRLSEKGISSRAVTAHSFVHEVIPCLQSAKHSERNNPLRVILGWSLGALTVLAALPNLPPLRGLVLVSPTPSFIARGGFPYGVPAPELRALERRLISDREGTLSLFFARAARGAYSPAQLRERVNRSCGLSLDELQWGLRYLAQTDLRAQLRGSAMNFDAVYGVADTLIPGAATHWLIRHGGAVGRALDGAHNLVEQYPVALSSLVLRRLQ